MKKIRLYKFYPYDSAIRNLEQKRLKISLIHELNDPFEFMNFQLPGLNLRRAWNEMRNDLSRTKGVICLTDNWRSPLMWAHYSDNHQGLALGFDISHDMAARVVYRKERERLHYEKLSKDQLHSKVEESLRTKFSHWEYEREYRLFSTLEDSEIVGGKRMFFKGFNADFNLCEVVVGARSDATSEKIRKAVGNKHLRVITSRVAFNSFEIVQQRNKKLQK